MTSLAAVMSKPLSRGMPMRRPPSPSTMFRSARSFMSITRRQITVRCSIDSLLPKCRWLSSIAASRLCAAAMAWKSPVKWRLMSSMGITWARPPPAAPPFIPMTGPSDGSRSTTQPRLPMAPSPWASPTDVVVLPSPAFVGVIAETRMSLPRGVAGSGETILALPRP